MVNLQIVAETNIIIKLTHLRLFSIMVLVNVKGKTK